MFIENVRCIRLHNACVQIFFVRSGDYNVGCGVWVTAMSAMYFVLYRLYTIARYWAGPRYLSGPKSSSDLNVLSQFSSEHMGSLWVIKHV